MTNPAADKSALLAEELKEFALTVPTTTFPKNFFCTICQELAFDSWKLICCNKSVCSSCHAKLEFPTTCPSCDHTPLEADSCVPNKALRNTMRAWLQKQLQRQKKRDEATPKAATPPQPAEATPGPADEQIAGDNADKPMESIETATKPEDFAVNNDAVAGDDSVEPTRRSGSAASQTNEQSLAPQPENALQRAQSQTANASVEPTSATQDGNTTQNPSDGTVDVMAGEPANMNASGMTGAGFGFGFTSNQGSFNGMGWNGMNPMNTMGNMMPNGNWNNVNPMDFNMMSNMSGMPNMPNGMYNGFGGNMGMAGMNDMSAMNMYGGGYGNWGQGANGAGYGNFNAYGQMGGYNQSGAQYPEMMNQFPKNNFPNQNRFHANGGAFPHQRNNRNGSFGGPGSQNMGTGPGFSHKANSRPESRSGPQNRDGQTPIENAEAATETKVKEEQPRSSAEPAQEGKEIDEGNPESTSSPTAQTAGGDEAKNPDQLTTAAGDGSNTAPQGSGLNPIQTVDSIEMDHSAPYDESTMIHAQQQNPGYAQGMMTDWSNQMPAVNGFDVSGMGYNQNNYGSRGGFNTAYGAATVLVGEPRGVGVVGAPTGPRAMREGRPNTGFSSRAINARSISTVPTANAPPPQETAPSSPPRRGRGSPERDETLRTKDRSPTRSRSRERPVDAELERARSVGGEANRVQDDRGATPVRDDHEHRKEERRHRSSRYDDRDDRDARDDRADHDDRYRDERDDRARSTSADSKHRSRRDKEKHRSSRSHRDRSREHRHRHRSRSRSPIAEDYDANGTDVDSSSRRKSRSEKDKHRDRERDSDRSRDKDRDRDRRDRRDRDYDRDHDYEREKDRSREKERDKDRKRSRRDRDDEEEHDYVEDKHRSSRRSRKDRDREREREYENEPKSATLTTRPVSPPINAPTGPSADGFSIRGFSKKKDIADRVTKPMPPPPTGPRAFQPPKGPAADRRDSNSRDHRRKGSVSLPSTPTTPSKDRSTNVQDHYAAEREKNARERDRLEKEKLSGRKSDSHSNSRSGSISIPTEPTSHKTKPSTSASSKRNRDVFDQSSAPDNVSEIKNIPTGPRSKRPKSGVDTNNVANLFAAGLRKHAGARERRRGGVKNEGSVERELERTEREREGGRR